MKKQRKKITMEDLAGMVQRGFLSVGKQIKGTDNRVVSLDARVVSLDARVVSLDARVVSLDARTKKGFEDVNKRVDDVHEDFKRTLDGLDKVAKHYDAYLKEVESRDAEVKRLKKWIEQIAQKVGVELMD